MKMPDDLSKPTPDEGLHKGLTFLAKSTVGLFPGGSFAAELYTLVVTDPAHKRRDRFMMDLSERIEKLEQEGRISIDELAGDERVSAIILTAIQSAQRSVGEEKLRSLASATMTAIGTVAERDRATISINIIDRMTDAHIVVLRCFGQAQGQLSDKMVHAYFLDQFQNDPTQSLDPREPFFPVLWRDMIAQGLIVEQMSQAFGGGEPFFMISPVGRFVLDYIGWKPKSK